VKVIPVVSFTILRTKDLCLPGVNRTLAHNTRSFFEFNQGMIELLVSYSRFFSTSVATLSQGIYLVPTSVTSYHKKTSGGPSGTCSEMNRKIFFH